LTFNLPAAMQGVQTREAFCQDVYKREVLRKKEKIRKIEVRSGRLR
jgi:hypothetical protein